MRDELYNRIIANHTKLNTVTAFPLRSMEGLPCVERALPQQIGNKLLLNFERCSQISYIMLATLTVASACFLS